jgi:hypothetical protein
VPLLLVCRLSRDELYIINRLGRQLESVNTASVLLDPIFRFFSENVLRLNAFCHSMTQCTIKDDYFLLFFGLSSIFVAIVCCCFF